MVALLELDGVTKSDGALKAADGLSLAVEEGEALGVIGPNGAGKSTMFNLVTGDVRPDAGRVVFSGRDVTAMAPHARSRPGIGRSYQIPHPFAKMTVFENLLVGAIFGGGRGERECYDHCAEVLDRVGLLGRANVPAGAFIFLQKLRLSPEAGFSINDWTVVAIFMVVIGGIGTLEGPIIGMLVYIFLRELLADFGTIYLIVMGAIAVAVMLKAPGGLWGWVARRYGLQLFPVRRRLAAPPPPR